VLTWETRSKTLCMRIVFRTSFPASILEKIKNLRDEPEQMLPGEVNFSQESHVVWAESVFGG
jgi:hypothetical protein